MKTENWYFTFGVGHGNRMFYVCIIGTRTSTRERMHELFGDVWAFQYTEKQFERQIERWNYISHPINNTQDSII